MPDTKPPFLSTPPKRRLHADTPNGCEYVDDVTRTPIDSNWMDTKHLRLHRGTSKRDAPKNGDK